MDARPRQVSAVHDSIPGYTGVMVSKLKMLCRPSETYAQVVALGPAVCDTCLSNAIDLIEVQAQQRSQLSCVTGKLIDRHASHLRYGEISSASNCTDYQARRLNIRYRCGFNVLTADSLAYG